MILASESLLDVDTIVICYLFLVSALKTYWTVTPNLRCSKIISLLNILLNILLIELRNSTLQISTLQATTSLTEFVSLKHEWEVQILWTNLGSKGKQLSEKEILKWRGNTWKFYISAVTKSLHHLSFQSLVYKPQLFGCRRAWAVASGWWSQEQLRCLPPSWRSSEQRWAVRWAALKLSAASCFCFHGQVLWLKRAVSAPQFYEGYGQTECTAGCSMSLPGDWSAGTTSEPHQNDLLCVCQINLSVCDSLESDGLFVDAGHVGAPLPCNYIKMVDVPEMNYLAANGEGEVSRWFKHSTEFSPQNPGKVLF